MHKSHKKLRELKFLIFKRKQNCDLNNAFLLFLHYFDFKVLTIIDFFLTKENLKIIVFPQL